ncbi:MAG: CDP-glycerol glycerophosphotransferase family protein [Spirochaetaceae bacterium]|jgi:hypothetical protein|nr:CDP-glycerol glycerophosphotransferase family protein [Spirochaetaceae bacterium]
MERGLIRVTGFYLHVGPYAAGSLKKYVPEHKFLLYIDLRDFVIDNTDALRPLDNFPVIRETNGYENDNFTSYPPPPRHVKHGSTLRARVFKVIFLLVNGNSLLRIISEWIKKSIPLPGLWTEARIKSLVRKGYKPLYTTEKIAVAIVAEWTLGHLDKILDNFNNDKYDLIYINFGSAQCKDYAKRHNCNVYSIQEIIKRKLCYKLAITNHTGNCGIYNAEFNYGIELIAQKLLFVASFVYIDYCKYIHFELYNYVICANEYQQKQFQQQINSDRLFVIGSPRFDDYKDDRETSRQIIERQAGKGIYRNKKNILWLPSHTEIASCLNFAPMLAKIQSKFNIIIKPHPYNYYEIHNFENRTRSTIPEIIIIKDVDYINLLPAVDFVICDYGGPVFSAIKADKNVLLFNTPKAELLTGITPDDPANVIRDSVINFYPDEEEKFFAALEDDAIWEKQKEIRRQIRAEFFAENPNPARDIAELCGRIMKDEV